MLALFALSLGLGALLLLAFDLLVVYLLGFRVWIGGWSLVS